MYNLSDFYLSIVRSWFLWRGAQMLICCYLWLWKQLYNKKHSKLHLLAFFRLNYLKICKPNIRLSVNVYKIRCSPTYLEVSGLLNRLSNPYFISLCCCLLLKKKTKLINWLTSNIIAKFYFHYCGTFIFFFLRNICRENTG